MYQNKRFLWIFTIGMLLPVVGFAGASANPKQKPRDCEAVENAREQSFCMADEYSALLGQLRRLEKSALSRLKSEKARALQRAEFKSWESATNSLCLKESASYEDGISNVYWIMSNYACLIRETRNRIAELGGPTGKAK